MRLLVAVLALAGALSAAEAGRLRTNSYWGGQDLPWSCDAVRVWAPTARAMPAATRAELIRKFNISRKMMRQAKECMK